MKLVELRFKLNVAMLESEAVHLHSPHPDHDQMGRVLTCAFMMMGSQYPDGHPPYPNAESQRLVCSAQVGMQTRCGVSHVISDTKHLH